MSWWRDAVVYQIYPRSFADSDGDGIGDLPGIVARLDHLVELGVDAVWLSPFFRSPQHDAGYDVADYRDVDPLFGSLADFDALVAATRERGLRLIVDLVPNHTSTEHVWFRAALHSPPGSPERARYHFRDGDRVPNGWQSVFGGSAWTQVHDGQWYLHMFDSSQPDLNWDHPEVRKEFEDILRFWLERGVAGFRVDVANGLVKASGLPDASPDDETPMWDQEGVHEIYRAWRRIADEYDGMLCGEAWVRSAERLARYVRPDEMHQAFNFMYLAAAWTAAGQRDAISAALTVNGVNAPATWVLSNHDVIRHASRLGYALDAKVPKGVGVGDPQPDAELGLRRARAATMLMLALPGVAYLYQGEELGLPEHTTLPDEARQDPTWKRSGYTERGRDGCRVPIPWEAGGPPAGSYGFGPGERSWLPQPPDWAEYSVQRQRGAAGSTYELYRAALRLRREYGLGSGALTWEDSDGLAFTNGALLVVTNFGPEPIAAPPDVLLASGPLTGDGQLPGDTTVWARRTG